MARNRPWAGSSPLRLSLVLLLALAYVPSALGIESNREKFEAGNIYAADIGLDPSLAFEETAQKGEKEGTFFNYKPIFNALKEAWGGKKDTGPISLSNNHPSRQNIAPGASQRFIIPLSELVIPRSLEDEALPPSFGMPVSAAEHMQQELRKRDDSPYRIYLTLSICRLPLAITGTDSVPPGLELSFSRSEETHSDNTAESTDVQMLRTEEGFVSVVENFSGDVSFVVQAPQVPGYSGTYTYEVAASIDDAYTNFNDYQSLKFIDSDHQGVMFTTDHLTDPKTKDEEAIESWMQTGGPFAVFIHQRNDPSFIGLRRSYCGVAENAHVHSSSPESKTRMTTLGGITAKQEFHLTGLESGSAYSAVLGLSSNFTKRGAGVPTGGGMVWRQADFQTNQDNNCQLISGLDFCKTVNYAVPSPANGSVDGTNLGPVYDNFANASYQNFSLSLQQIACKATNDSQYSLATNCENCDTAYRRWICAVAIPRCADESVTSSAYIPRNASDSSRNSILNTQIQPGPYSELPPCGNLCQGLVQNCPAAMGFACPAANTWEYNQTYGYQDPNSNEATCNALDTAPGPNGSMQLRPSLLSVFIAVAFYSFGMSLGLI